MVKPYFSDYQASVHNLHNDKHIFGQFIYIIKEFLAIFLWEVDTANMRFSISPAI